jgi:hypothetical protein
VVAKAIESNDFWHKEKSYTQTRIFKQLHA